VALDHVAEGAGVLVVAAAPFDAEGLGGGDLDVVDVLPVPDRVEEAVGEAEGEDVLDRLFPEVVVDPVDLALREHRRHLGDQFLGAAEIMADRLLDHQPVPALGRLLVVGLSLQHAGGRKPADDRREEVRRGRQVKEAVAQRATFAVDRPQPFAKGGEGGRGVELTADVEERPCEQLPAFGRDRRPSVGGDRLSHLGLEGRLVPVSVGDADDGEPFRERLADRQVVEGGHQLAGGEVAADAEDHHRAGRRGPLGPLVAEGIGLLHVVAPGVRPVERRTSRRVAAVGEAVAVGGVDRRGPAGNGGVGHGGPLSAAGRG
jgi:hypothetical protein